MKPMTPEDKDLENMIRQAGESEIPDDGFSQRVMRALPPRRANAQWRRWILAGAATAAVALMAGGLSGNAGDIPALATRAIAFASNPIAVIILGLTVAAALVLAADDYLGLEL
jgi:predicted anti-sigma-YlaC factor YlaD